MSFRVNTNVMAMNALRNLTMTNVEFGKSVSRLSTGLRINSAADDPAGLIASETFRAQIGGLDQAIRNSQDAMNYAKTAEGALDEVNRLLRDARTLAVASANSGALTESQRQANQSQLQSIASSIDRIASNTAFGTKKLLNGSAGVNASVTLGTNFSAISFSGTFAGQAIVTNSGITVEVTTLAERAGITGSQTFTNATDLVGAGSFTINGKTFTTTATTTVNDVVALINDSAAQTGVTATYAAGQGVRLNSVGYGSNARIDLTDSSAILQSSAGSVTDTGQDAVATVSIDINGSDAGGVTTATFTGGRYGNDGLTLTDSFGNRIRLTEAGNVTGANLAGQLTVGTAQFQLGANAGETANLSLGNFAATELGDGVVSGLNLSNLDLSTASGATDALRVIDAAIEEVSRSRGEIGSFVRNNLESNVRSIGIARENLAATDSTIRDIDVASEMTNFTKLQIIQQSGISVLAQANSAPQAVLNLLRG
jgi:flagellin